MVQDFSTRFHSFYLHMNAWQKLTMDPVYMKYGLILFIAFRTIFVSNSEFGKLYEMSLFLFYLF